MKIETTIPANFPKTLVDAVHYFSEKSVALHFFAALRWPEGVKCPTCGSDRVHFLAKYSRWKCSVPHPKQQFTVKVGSVMEDSPMGLDKWAVAVWLEVNAKNSISSWELHRALGITQKSAWFMLHRVRFALKNNFDAKLGGKGFAIEADETYVGGLAKNMHARKRRKAITANGPKGKTVVMGLLERHSGKKHSIVKATVLDDGPTKEVLHDVIHKNVEPGSIMMTDSHAGYRGLPKEQFGHLWIDHTEKYVEGMIHTNGIENFWSLFKRCIKGTHVSVEPSHLLAYVDSEAFRFNNRKMNDAGRFVSGALGIHGKRLTYKALIGALGSAPASDKDAGSESLPN